MNTLDDLCETFEDMAGDGDGRGLVEAARAGAARIRRRRRIAGAVAAAAVVAVVAVAAPMTAVRLRATDGNTPAAPAPYRAPSEITLGVRPEPGFFVLSHGTDATRQFLIVRNRDTEVADSGGTINLYDPGTFDPAALRRGERVTVAGHLAYLVPTLDPGSPARPKNQVTVGWQDASGAWVTVAEAQDRTALLRLAESVRIGPPEQITSPMRFGWVPDELPLAWVSNADDPARVITPDSFVGFAADRVPAPDPLVPAAVARRGLALTAWAAPKPGWNELVAPQGAPPGTVPTPVWETIGGQRAWYLPDDAQPGLVTPGPGAHLFVDVGDCGIVIAVADRAQISRAELARMVAGMTFSSCADVTAWRPILS